MKKDMFSKYVLEYSEDKLLYSIKDIPLTLPKRKTGKGKQVYRYDVNTLMRSHWRAVNSMRVAFHKTHIESFKQAKIYPTITEPCHVLFIYYAPDARRRDLDNMVAIAIKFSFDTAVAACVLADDNMQIVSDLRSTYGGIRRTKPNHCIDMHIFKY